MGGGEMSNWWANRLQSQGGPQSRTRPTNLPARQQRPQYQQQPPPPPEEEPAPVQPSSQRRPPSSMQDDHCPSCGSGNYMAAPGSNYHRCYECGYPIVQSGTGVGGVKTDGTVKKATQVEGGGYRPSTIIGRVE